MLLHECSSWSRSESESVREIEEPRLRNVLNLEVYDMMYTAVYCAQCCIACFTLYAGCVRVLVRFQGHVLMNFSMYVDLLVVLLTECAPFNCKRSRKWLLFLKHRLDRLMVDLLI